ncbi:MAG: DUF1801 domain-containing protein [Planctomycetota bacterium]|nr:DUF1801 domain-containing protein [Planctomycetota bacterium]
MAKNIAKPKGNRVSGNAGSQSDHRPPLADWRRETLARMRALILEADPEIIEEVKWRKPSNNMTGVPVWSHGGIICTGETYKNVVKLTFANGASLADPAKLFNSSLEGNTRRAIDIRERETINAAAFKKLVQAAVAVNTQSAKAKTKPVAKQAKSVKLLSGGNPQIAKADGDAPVQAYIAAMPGWKRELGEQLDALITRAVPKVRKAVKWNSPFYGIEGQGWFLSYHVLTKYVKVTFFAGMSLSPVPPGGTEKSKEARWIDIYEDQFDEAQFTKWVKQAAKLPGWMT